MSYSRARKQRRQVEAWIAERTRKGFKCSECGVTFTADRGDGKKLAVLPMPGGAGVSFYVLCNSCGVKLERDGQSAIPNTRRDSRIAGLMSPYVKAPEWVH